MVELSGVGDRCVSLLPAEALREWQAQADSTLEVCGLDLSQADLSGADLAMGLLVQTVLRGARLVGVDLYRARLDDAVLDLADLTGAEAVKAVLDGASCAGRT